MVVVHIPSRNVLQEFPPTAGVIGRNHEVANGDKNGEHYPVVQIQAQHTRQLSAGRDAAMLIFVGQAITAQYHKETHRPAGRCNPGRQRNFPDVDQPREQKHVTAAKEVEKDHHHDDDALDNRAIVSGNIKHICL